MPKPKSDPPPSSAEERSPRLSPERILRVARDLVEGEGLDGLSMRRLAEELDVWPMAVYRYFRDKDELLDAMLGAAAEDAKLPDGRGHWRRQMHALLAEVRGALGRYSSGLGIPTSRVLLSAGGLRLSEAGLRILASAGLPPSEAAKAWRALFGYAVSFPSFGDAGEEVRDARVAIAGLSKDEYPELVGAADEFAVPGDDRDQFEYGVERLLDGLEARARDNDPRKAAA